MSLISAVGMIGAEMIGLEAITVARAAPRAKVTKRAFRYDGGSFWRASGARAPLIGGYGQKRRATGIAPYDHLADLHLKGSLKASGVYPLNFKRLKRWGVSVDDLHYIDMNGSRPVEQARANKLKLKLIYLTADHASFIEALNADRRAREFMKRSSSRVVSAVWVVTTAKLASTLSSARKLSALYREDALYINTSKRPTPRGYSARTPGMVSIPRSAVFAYVVSKAQWTKRGLKKLKIKALEDDLIGLR